MEVVPIRAEVIETRRNRKAGAIVLARPVPIKVRGRDCGRWMPSVSRVGQWRS